MNKSKLPFKAQPGDIIFTRQKSIGSWALRILHGPFPYSHACLVGETVNGRPTIYTAGHTGENSRPFAFLNHGYYKHLDAVNYLSDKNYTICRYTKKGHGLSAAQKEKIIGWCKDQLGEKYPAKKVMKYLREGMRGVGIDEIDFPAFSDQEHCFEGIAEAYLRAGIELNKRAHNIDPSGYDGKEIFLSPNLKDIYESSKSKTRALA